MTIKKVALIGLGSVGSTFLYSAINQNLADHYYLMDRSFDISKGNEMDLEDTLSALGERSSKIESVTDYNKIADADIIVITAGRPQLPGELRVEMLKDNLKIMKEIATNIKNTSFNGITLIVANPVDFMTDVYQRVTQFDKSKVISSGTSLDTARLKISVSNHIGINPNSIDISVIGEHGENSVSTFSSAKVGGMDAAPFFKKANFNTELMAKIHKDVVQKAFEIIRLRRATYYGIGSMITKLVDIILNDKKEIVTIGAKLNGQYGLKDIYFGTPCLLGAEGILEIFELPLNEDEKEQVAKAAAPLKEQTKFIAETIKNG